MAKTIVAILGALGLALNLAALLATFVWPTVVEDVVTGFAREQVEQEVRERLQDPGADPSALADWYEGRAEDLSDFIETRLPFVVDVVVAAMCRSDACRGEQRESFRELVSQIANETAREALAEYKAIPVRLREFIRGRYLSLVQALIDEIRRFTGINAAVLALMLVLLAARWTHPRQVLLPASLLLLAVAATATVYTLSRDWFFSILLEQYPGWGYLAYVAIVFGLLMDVAFNRGRVVQAILDSIAAPFSGV